MIAAVELISALARRTRDAALVAAALRQLETIGQVEFTARHRDVALRLAGSGLARDARRVSHGGRGAGTARPT
jgi:hypothetical protein